MLSEQVAWLRALVIATFLIKLKDKTCWPSGDVCELGLPVAKIIKQVNPLDGMSNLIGNGIDRQNRDFRTLVHPSSCSQSHTFLTRELEITYKPKNL